MTELPMFPLGSVLFPHMPLPLRVFEPRYLAMLSHILETEPSEFGVVLIERGHEVGGGEGAGVPEKRFAIGTVAQITELDAAEEFVVLIAQGDRRVEVTEWLEDAPYPRAMIREVADLRWNESLAKLREHAERSVRSALAVANELGESVWSAEVELSAEPIESVWQLAAIAPVGPLDQITMLRSTSTEELLNSIIELSEMAELTLSALRPE